MIVVSADGGHVLYRTTDTDVGVTELWQVAVANPGVARKVNGALVASSRTQLQSALALASARGLLTLKQAAGVVEFDFASLLTPAEQVLLHESD